MTDSALSRIATQPVVSHAEMANAIRFLAIDAVENAKSGHPGMPMGMADVATVLFSRFLKFDPADPAWPDRDRFVLSAGHGSMLLYALLYLTGYEGLTLEELRSFRQWGSKTPGHPEYGHTPGVETTTGPLGQVIATAVGMALAERLMNARFGSDFVDHYTYVIAGDGCLMEGLSHEAISLAGHLALNRLIVLFDDNEISIDGPTSLSCSDDQLARFGLIVQGFASQVLAVVSMENLTSLSTSCGLGATLPLSGLALLRSQAMAIVSARAWPAKTRQAANKRAETGMAGFMWRFPCWRGGVRTTAIISASPQNSNSGMRGPRVLTRCKTLRRPYLTMPGCKRSRSRFGVQNWKCDTSPGRAPWPRWFSCTRAWARSACGRSAAWTGLPPCARRPAGPVSFTHGAVMGSHRPCRRDATT